MMPSPDTIKKFVRPRASPACTECAKKKIKCHDVPGQKKCRKCIEGGLECERPTGDAAPSGRVQTKKACSACKRDKSRCEVRTLTSPSCVRCAEKSSPCSFASASQPGAGPSYINGGGGSSSSGAGTPPGGGGGAAPNLSVNTQQTHTQPPAGSSSSPHSPKTYWDTVLSPTASEE